jgi:hypothetical protein
MLQLYQFYFGKTDREPYLAKIDGSNLIREILETVRRKAGLPINGCPHAAVDSKFVGLVGHDTNLANVGTLLKLSWTFDDSRLPPDTLGLPANDALPAGALVFELRKGSDGHFVRVYYVTQTLSQMQNGPSDHAVRIAVQGPACQRQPGVCDIPLNAFDQLVTNAIGKEFLSACVDGNQVCCQVSGPKPPSPASSPSTSTRH